MTTPWASGHAGDMETSVTNHPERGRFELTVDGELAGFLEYRLSGSTAVMPHTVVFDQFGGQGLGAVLARTALDHAKAEGWTVDPQCWYLAGYIDKHPEYQDLVAVG